MNSVKIGLFGPLTALLLLSPRLACSQDIAGDWHGLIEVKDDAPLRLAMLIVGGHPLRASINSIDEGEVVPVDAILMHGSMFRFEITTIGGSYQGEVASDGSRIVGLWIQDGGTWPLTWLRGEDPAMRARPLSERETLERGRACTQSLYEARVSELWSKLSPVMQQDMGGESGLGELRQRFRARLGAETALITERVHSEGMLQVYTRTAKFDLAPAAEVRFVFNPSGHVAGIDIRPVDRRR